MSKVNLHVNVQSVLFVFVSIAALTTGVALSISFVSRDTAHAQEKLRAFPNEDFQASIVQILAHRDKYHGKKVQVSGFLHVKFEDSAIYLSKEDADYGISANGFWASFDKTKVPFEGVGPSKFDRKFVLIEGTFNANSRGHLSAWQGSIDKISRIYELRKRR